jgi:uncharacterized protein
VIALDTNLVVYAHRIETNYSQRAFDLVVTLAQGSVPWSIPTHCLHEFVAVVSNPKIWAQPSSPDQIEAQIEAWTSSPSFVEVSENRASIAFLMGQLRSAAVKGGMVHDARIVAACQAAGIRELLSIDRDFSRFSGLSIRNPFRDS